MATYAPQAPAIPGSLSVSIPATFWLVGATLLGLFLYYMVGIDQGALSIFGSDSHVHEFVHDARHLLGYPCH